MKICWSAESPSFSNKIKEYPENFFAFSDANIMSNVTQRIFKEKYLDNLGYFYVQMLFVTLFIIFNIKT